MNWDEVLDAGSHFVSVLRLERDAQKRLIELGLDDLDELMSFRCGGKQRVWCVLEGNTMRVLWWDPNHEVCP